MCAIVGLVSSDGDIGPARIEQCVDRMRERGPDGSGNWVNSRGRVGLGHRRLAMVGVEQGSQPIFSQDKTVVAVVNGEFYGFRSIRERLQSLGHRFYSQSDSEILVHLYQEYGLKLFDHLRGEFAFLLWDETTQRLIAARDRFGIKPLVWFERGNVVGFASKPTAFFGEVKSTQWDLHSLATAATLQYLPPTSTLFKGIYQVPPGHYATVYRERVEFKRYWQFDYPTQQEEQSRRKPHYRETVNTTRSLIVNSVLDRIADEVPSCFHLSGGIDSSAVLGIASRETSKRQKAYAICCSGDGYDEKEFALAAARDCDADLHCLEFTDQQYIDAIHRAARASAGLAINGHLPAKYLLNRQIRADGYKAALTGEGADEVFLGYAHFQADWRCCRQSRLPIDVGTERRSSLGMMLPMGVALSTQALEKELGFVPTFLKAKATMGHRIHSLVSDDFLAAHLTDESFSRVSDFIEFDQIADRHSVHQSAWIWSRLALAGYILNTLGDGTEMAFSIEGRVPFLDHHLFEFVRDLPLRFFFQNGATKQLLRDAVRPYVPDEIYRRVKHPFDTQPFLLNGSHVAREFLSDQLNSDAFRSQPVFCHRKVADLIGKIEAMDRTEKQLWDPVVMFLSTLVGIEELMN